MKIYFAGTMGIASRERKLQKFIANRLLSFWDLWNNQFAVPFAFKLIIKKKKNDQSIR